MGGRSATVLGLDSTRDREELKRRIGVQLQAGAYFSYLTLEEILTLFGSFYPPAVATRRSCSGAWGCSTSGAQVRHLSGGQARRFSVVAALVNDPDVVFYTFSDERRGKRGRGTRLPLVRRR